MDKRILYLPSILFGLAGVITTVNGTTSMGVMWMSLSLVWLIIAIKQARKKSADPQ